MVSLPRARRGWGHGGLLAGLPPQADRQLAFHALKPSAPTQNFFEIFIIIIFWNVLLAFFNLIPIPPLDGSKLLFSIFPMRIETLAMLEQFGFFFLIFVVVLFSGPLGYFLNLMLSLFLRITI